MAKALLHPLLLIILKKDNNWIHHAKLQNPTGTHQLIYLVPQLIFLYTGSYLSRYGDRNFEADCTVLIFQWNNTQNSAFPPLYIFLVYQVPWQHTETLGIQCCTVYWPMKIGNRLILFRLEVWDAGDNSVKRYNHVLPVSLSMVFAVKYFELDV